MTSRTAKKVCVAVMNFTPNDVSTPVPVLACLHLITGLMLVNIAVLRGRYSCLQLDLRIEKSLSEIQRIDDFALRQLA